PASGYRGANVTIPHKLAALEVADSASEAATGIGAANTLTFADGHVEAENTDAAGLQRALERPMTGLRTLVLGAGGAGRAAGWARGGGAHVVDGIEVLVRQGALSFELWTGRPAPLEAMRAAARSARA